MIGLTFMNFEPDKILSTLRQIGPRGSRFLVASEMITSENTLERILSQYRVDEARKFAFGPLKLAGVAETAVEYDVAFANGRVEFVFRINDDVPKVLSDRGVRIGDRVKTAVSYRYAMSELNAAFVRHGFSGRAFFSPDGRTAVVALFERSDRGGGSLRGRAGQCPLSGKKEKTQRSDSCRASRHKPTLKKKFGFGRSIARSVGQF
jgi:hypothetical protein